MFSIRGMMVSFGNASRTIVRYKCSKSYSTKNLYLVRPSMQQYLSKERIDEAAKTMFEKIKSGKDKIKIFKKYKLDEVVQAHKDLRRKKNFRSSSNCS